MSKERGVSKSELQRIDDTELLEQCLHALTTYQGLRCTDSTDKHVLEEELYKPDDSELIAKLKNRLNANA